VAVKRVRRLLLLAALGFLAWQGCLYWREHRFDQIIDKAARRYGVEPALIKAVVWRESGFDPEARGRAGELGLMQIREAAAREWAAAEHVAGFEPRNCLNPLTNVLAGTWYLKRVLRHYGQTDDPLPYGLAEYNAGRGNVLKWLAGERATNSAAFTAEIGFPATRAYVRAVLRRREHYR
jgi:soluble lytic murein transglycosylase